MEAYKSETTLVQDGTVTLKDLPFRAGQHVEVIVQAKTNSTASPKHGHDPLRGTILGYDDPTEPVAGADWEALR